MIQRPRGHSGTRKRTGIEGKGVGRRLLAYLARYGEKDAGTERIALGWVMVLLMLAAWFTDIIRLYALVLKSAVAPVGRNS